MIAPANSDIDGICWHPSRFNFTISRTSSAEQSIALFNSATGALTKIEGPEAMSLAALLNEPKMKLSKDMIDESLFVSLSQGGFIIPSDKNEIASIRERFSTARYETPAVLTITTTMDCNLGCYYCYEERSQTALSTNSVDQILALVDRTVRGTGRKALHVDWYGGEPLLNFEFLEVASKQLQEYCCENGIVYHASIISNGTMWPSDPIAFVKRHGIRQVQISFDGMRANHDKRRRTRKGFRYLGNKILLSSFDEAAHLVDALVDVVRVDIRFNMDRKNLPDLLPFIDFAELSGWFSAKFPAVVQPARLAAYSPSSSFMRSTELSLEDFDEARSTIRKRLWTIAKVEESEIPDGYPFPKRSVCAALANASSVVGADGAIFRCGLQVGENAQAVGHLSDEANGETTASNKAWWANFDPTILPTCSKCSFLPVCWGGCPKKHLECDSHAIAEQGRYWRTNLPRLIAQAAEMTDDFSPKVFSDHHQFKDEGAVHSP